MYKTVRKGDASLQYTILPQTDQFSSGGFPQSSGKTQLRIIKYAIGALMVLITMSCVATPFLMHQNDHNLFAGTTLAMSRVEPARNASRSVQTKDALSASQNKNKGRTPTTATVPTTEVTKRKDLEDTTTSFGGILRGEEDEAMVDDATLADIPETNAQRGPSTPETSTSAHQFVTTSSPSPSPAPTTTTPTKTTMSASSSTLPTTSRTSSSSTAKSTTASSTLRKSKMPRVTLKLRKNETIPQMFMKAGIASYKKGNITTSVLAHGLSLEGLIFKTPEGTIKPWPQKWFFSDPSADFQWKAFAVCMITGIDFREHFSLLHQGGTDTVSGSSFLMKQTEMFAKHRKQIARGSNPEVNTSKLMFFLAQAQKAMSSVLTRLFCSILTPQENDSTSTRNAGPIQMPVLLYVLFAGVAALASAIIFLIFHMQRKASKRQRPNIEEPEVEEHEEDKSTLLGAENQEAEEKE